MTQRTIMMGGGAAGAVEPATRLASAPSAEPGHAPGWRSLLGYLHEMRGIDFGGYKPATLVRRIRKRMDAAAVADYAAYQGYLEAHPDELQRLLDTALINVTAFFRDPETWSELAETVVPAIIASKVDDAPIRVWSAGCASGEEAYTLAILFAEAMGTDRLRDRVTIYATDIDEDALAAARRATYPPRQMEGVRPGLRDRYFEQCDGDWVFRKDLRRAVVFGRHDLLRDAPISRIDLLACRNALMYFRAEAQAQILARLHFALNPGGILCLGRAETLMAHSAGLAPVGTGRRMWRKVGDRPSGRMAPRGTTGADRASGSG